MDPYLYFLIGQNYESKAIRGINSDKNHKLAIEHYKKGIDDKNCRYWLAMAYMDGKYIEKDIEKAITLLAEKPNTALGICTLGEYYRENNQPQLAFGHFKRSSTLGHARATWNMAMCHEDGFEVEKNKNMAKNTYTQYLRMVSRSRHHVNKATNKIASLE